MTKVPVPIFRDPLRALLVAQFFGAFNDNAWKLVVALLAIRSIGPAEAAGLDYQAAAQSKTTLAFVVFTLPLMIFSLPAGVLADRVSKRTILVGTKLLELALMVLGTIVLYQWPQSTRLPLLVLGAMGLMSALFSPAKYGILPEILRHEQLSGGNARLEMWTFLAIIGGSAAGGWMLDASPAPWFVGALLTVFAGIGCLAALAVPRVPPARAEGGLVDTVVGAWRVVRADRVLGLAVLGATFFWTIASLLGQDVLVYIKSVLGVSDQLSGMPMAAFGIGVGAGAMLAARLSGGKVEYGLIPLGAIGLALGALTLGIVAPGFVGTTILMASMGAASGLLIVPLHALLQWRSPADRRGGVIALSNVLVFGGILAGSLIAETLSRQGLSARGILVAGALATLAGTAWAVRLLPDSLLRLTLVLATHSIYRLRVIGRDRIPERGGALLAPNHVSFIDGLLLLASVDRRIRFVVDAGYFHSPILGPFLRTLGAIPISSSGGPRQILRALREAGRYVDEGELVCVFPEGQITRTGLMQPFRRGIERIVRGRDVRVIPVHLDQVWGSVFSRSRGRFLTKLPERIPYPVTVSFGEPLSSEVKVEQIRQAVQELGEAAARARAASRRTLHRSFISVARRHPLAIAFAEEDRPRLGRLASLAAAVTLARALRRRWRDDRFVAVLLPPSIAGALVNLAATLAGRVTVNLNFTAARAGMASALRQTGATSVVTSRTFLERARIELPEGVTPIWIEELAASIGPLRRAFGFVLAAAAPARLLERFCGAAGRPAVDDVLTVIFSSGSTGEPKGVLLTHANVDANIEALSQVFHLRSTDRLLGILPLFHSFGYLALWFSATHRLGTIFHPNPLDAGKIGELVQRFRVTMVIATPTFLQLYLRRCTPAQFGSLRIVLAGAEKLSERLAVAFEDRFGIRPLEGYGATECAPAIAVSAPDFRARGFYQPGSRRGFVGQPIPGVAVRIVDPESFASLPTGTSGLLLVRGPNIMKGYIGREDLTAETMRDGWYVTGDIAELDEDGFLRITDRLSRFSKIGGEMVPHGRVEDALHTAAGVTSRSFAVTAVPDERKGERLAVLHTLDEARIPETLERLGAQGLPNLFIPRRDAFVRVDHLPVLGTGKLDLREIRRLAHEALK